MRDKPNPIKILLVDDHEVLRDGLKYIIEVFDDIEVIGEAEDGLQAVELYADLKPDLVLMDLIMPEMNGIQATKLIKAKDPDAVILILSSAKEEDMVNEALEAGAIGYLTKNISTDEISKAIRNAISGIPTLSPDATKAIIQAKVHKKTEVYELTQREIQVLEQMGTGMTNPEIADVLFISKATVKRHVSNIITKLDVNNRTEAVALAIKNKLISGR